MMAMFSNKLCAINLLLLLHVQIARQEECQGQSQVIIPRIHTKGARPLSQGLLLLACSLVCAVGVFERQHMWTQDAARVAMSCMVLNC
jgi:hypothetical protein